MKSCKHCGAQVPLEKAALVLQKNRLLHVHLTCPTCGAGYETWLCAAEFQPDPDRPPTRQQEFSQK